MFFQPGLSFFFFWIVTSMSSMHAPLESSGARTSPVAFKCFFRSIVTVRGIESGVGLGDGEGLADGELLGEEEGDEDGELLGDPDGEADGDPDGELEGDPDGEPLAEPDSEGSAPGSTLMVPSISGWIVQWYGYPLGFGMGFTSTLQVSPGAMAQASVNPLSTGVKPSATRLWLRPLPVAFVFSKVIVSIGATVTGSGLKHFGVVQSPTSLASTWWSAADADV
jgi:hypothetical protein